MNAETAQEEVLDPDRVLDLPGVLDDLVRDGVLTRTQAESILVTTRRKEQLSWHPLQFIAHLEPENQRLPGTALDLEWLTHWLSDKSGLPYFRIDPLKIKPGRCTEVMSYAYAQRHGILAVEVNDHEIVVATAQPWVRSWEAMLKQTARVPQVRRVLVNPADLGKYTLEFYTLARSVSKATDKGGNAPSGVTNLEQLLELGALKSPDANDAHVVTIVDWLLQYAFDQRASDIHIEPRRESGKVRFRIDGVLHNVYELPPPVTSAVVSRLKILGRMDLAEKRRPQDGRIKTKSPEGNEIELRLSTLPTAFGEKLVMRIFDPDVLLRSFEELGLGGEDYRRWHGMITQPNGIVLVTGPTGSGKTTTLYSTLKQLATPEVNVCTIEDPIEMVEPAFNQMQVQTNIDLTFAAGVRALLRQDPDIIMVGEIRDLETAEMAIQAALTGHLVIATLHTNDAPSAITRLLELGVPPYLLRATVLGVMAQRLIRTLCMNCRSPAAIDPEAWKLLTTPFKAPQPDSTYAPHGCLECRDTGYRGRVGIYEIMVLDEAVAAMVTDDCDLAQLRVAGLKAGMRTLRLAGALKVAAGLTTPDEVLRVAPISGSS